MKTYAGLGIKPWTPTTLVSSNTMLLWPISAVHIFPQSPHILMQYFMYAKGYTHIHIQS